MTHTYIYSIAFDVYITNKFREIFFNIYYMSKLVSVNYVGILWPTVFVDIAIL